MHKKGAKDQIAYTRYGKFNPASSIYQITLDFSKDMEHLNGDYDIKIHASDYRAEKSEVWDLGTITVYFKQGLDEGNNQGVKEAYKSEKVIEHYFHPEQPE